jgi:hypothetical protein
MIEIHKDIAKTRHLHIWIYVAIFTVQFIALVENKSANLAGNFNAYLCGLFLACGYYGKK